MDNELRERIARAIWAYQECPWDFDHPDSLMGDLQKQIAIDEAERIRVVVVAYFASGVGRIHEARARQRRRIASVVISVVLGVIAAFVVLVASIAFAAAQTPVEEEVDPAIFTVCVAIEPSGTVCFEKTGERGRYKKVCATPIDTAIPDAQMPICDLAVQSLGVFVTTKSSQSFKAVKGKP